MEDTPRASGNWSSANPEYYTALDQPLLFYCIGPKQPLVAIAASTRPYHKAPARLKNLPNALEHCHG